MKKIERLLGAAVIGGLGILAVAVIHPPLAAQGPNAGANPRASAPAKTAAPSTTPAPSAAHVEARALGNAFSEVAKKSLPLVASIRVEARVAQQGLPPGFEQFFGMGAPQPGIQRGGGSGIVVRSDGHILTNNHVVENADRIDVRLHDGRTFRAQVVGRDPASDLAVIKIDVKNLPAAKFADSDRAEIGEWVVAIGSPFGLDYSVTSGVLSAKGRGSMGASEIGDYLQTDASINPGNSGGPLVDLDGNVLGINTFIIGRGTGIGFAIPSAIAQNVSKQIIEQGVVKRAWIGVSFQEITPELASYFSGSQGHGALVSAVLPGAPAAKAGLLPGDVITHVAGRALNDATDLQREVLRVPVGSHIKLSVLRDGKAIALDLLTAERPGDLAARSHGKTAPKSNAQPRSALGLSVETLTPALRSRLGYGGPGDVVVSNVQPGSPADRAGLSRGDVVLMADRKVVRSVQDLDQALRDGRALLRVRRGEGEVFLVLQKD